MNRPLISRWLPLAALAFAPLAHAQLLTDTQPKTVQSVLESVNRYCSGCHKVPSPSVMPKSGWPRDARCTAGLSALTSNSPIATRPPRPQRMDFQSYS